MITLEGQTVNNPTSSLHVGALTKSLSGLTCNNARWLSNSAGVTLSLGNEVVTHEIIDLLKHAQANGYGPFTNCCVRAATLTAALRPEEKERMKWLLLSTSARPADLLKKKPLVSHRAAQRWGVFDPNVWISSLKESLLQTPEKHHVWTLLQISEYTTATTGSGLI